MNTLDTQTNSKQSDEASQELDAVSFELHPSHGKSAAEVVNILRDPIARQEAIDRRRRQLIARRSLATDLEIIANRNAPSRHSAPVLIE